MIDEAQPIQSASSNKSEKMLLAEGIPPTSCMNPQKMVQIYSCVGRKMEERLCYSTSLKLQYITTIHVRN